MGPFDSLSTLKISEQPSYALPTIPLVATCRVCDLDRQLVGRGKCRSCYNRDYRAELPIQPCSACGRTRRLFVGAWCQTCYESGRAPRACRSDDSHIPIMLSEASPIRPTFGDARLPRRFWSRVRVLDTGCWEWSGGTNDHGYGRFYVNPQTGKKRLAHRVLYGALVGPLVAEMTIDHLCHNADLTCPGGRACRHRLCVNPGHLEQATSGDNTRRARIPLRKSLARSG